ncbi:hypothetical protein IC620_01085 [Hazenella sp. IB182357]|uniref:YugN-like family protein n=1 Tax=Polycladospora coralii TaxID=2771432 RepID=A0A926N6Z3_9BACL|nr:YugN family protein [Polycladospora coralii]MBD1370956.1 hypothetical protein [Polycladospora coralii]MBS7529895.1 hypothetical protein [Polycladospora coralii]
MILNEIKTKGIKKEFRETEKVLKSLGFVRWAWDYEKATYDYKYNHDGKEYYLRLRGTVINDKQLEHPKALLELGTPVFARHFFPHGLDDSVEIPKDLLTTVNEKLKEMEAALI